MKICATCSHLRYNHNSDDNRLYRCFLGLEAELVEAEECPSWSPFTAGEAS